MELRYSHAVYMPVPGHSGGQQLSAPARIVHHTTEGDTFAGAFSAYKATGDFPTFTDSFEGGIYRVWQHLDLNQSATALKHPLGTVETNRANCVQIEHVGRAARSGAFPEGYLAGIASLCRWIEAQTGCARRAAASFSSPPRLSATAWINNSGHFGHCHVPNNDHTDPGVGFSIDKVLSLVDPHPPAPAPTPSPVLPIFFEETDVQTKPVAVTTSKPGEANAGCGWNAFDTGAPVRACWVSKQGPFPPADGYWPEQTQADISCQPRGNQVIVDVRNAVPGSTVVVWTFAVN